MTAGQRLAARGDGSSFGSSIALCLQALKCTPGHQHHLGPSLDLQPMQSRRRTVAKWLSQHWQQPRRRRGNGRKARALSMHASL